MNRQEILTNVFTQLKLAGFVKNKGDFANQLSYTKCYLSSAFSGKRPGNLNSKLFRKIQEVFPQVNAAYVTMGEGPVLLTGQAIPLVRSMPYNISDSSLLDCLVAEKESLRQSMERVDQMIELFCPRYVKSAC